MKLINLKSIIIVGLLSFLLFQFVLSTNINNNIINNNNGNQLKSHDHLQVDIGSNSNNISLDSNSNNNSSNSNDGGKGTLVNQRDANTIIFIIMLILTGSVLIVYFIVSLDIPFIPESVAIVTYGIILGVVFRFFYSDIIEHVVNFEPENFFLFILPVIIFETGFSMPKTDFFNNIVGIVMFAVFGTIITFLVVGLGIFGVGQLGLSVPLPLRESLTFGAIVSSTDPVCTLAIFQALNVDPMLYMLILGESILNDATSILLYRIAGDTSTRDIIISCAMFAVVMAGSVLLGVLMALLLSLILKWINIGKFPALETIFMVMFSYMSYVLANALDISGVLAVFFFGITFAQYGAYSLSPYTKLTSRQLFRTAAFISETFLFVYFGLSLTAHDFNFNIGLFSWSIFFTLLARAISVFPISFLLNKFLKKPIPLPIQVAIFFGGLRGAFAFSLSLDYVSPWSSYIRTNTLLVVVFTIFVFGIGTYPLLKLLGIKTSESDQSLDNISKPMNKKTKTKDRTKLYESFDDRYFKPWFRKKVAPLGNEAIEIFEKMVHQSSNDNYELANNPPLHFDDYSDDHPNQDQDQLIDLIGINDNNSDISINVNSNNNNNNNDNDSMPLI